MKQISQLLIILIAVVFFNSCKKNNEKLTALASLNVTNAVVGGTSVKFGSRTTAIANNNFTRFGLVAGLNDLYIYPSTDSLNPYYNEAKFVANEGEVYSLFLMGIPGAVEAIKIKETIPYRTDSTAGIRFINLAPNKPSLDITLSSTPGVKEVTALNYKSYTEFKTYAALRTSSFNFQVRDASNPGTVLTTFTLSATQLPRFAHITLVIRQNGATGVSVFRVNNDR